MPKQKDAPATDAVHPDDEATAKAKIAYGRIREPIFESLMEVMSRLAVPFSKMTEQQQHDFMRSVRSRLDAGLERALLAIIDADLPQLTAKLGDFTVKDDAIVGKYEVARTQNAIVQLGAHGLKPVHIILADPKLMDDGSYDAKEFATPDQPGFDDLLNRPANDDRDLAGDEDANDEEDDGEHGRSTPADPEAPDPSEDAAVH